MKAMTNPWNDIDKAFEPMMTDCISFFGSRGGMQHKTTVKACLFPIESIDTLVENDIESDVKMVSITAKEDAFMPYDKKMKPQVGDTFITENDEKYKVTSVNRSNGFFDIIGRSF